MANLATDPVLFPNRAGKSVEWPKWCLRTFVPEMTGAGVRAFTVAKNFGTNGI